MLRNERAPNFAWNAFWLGAESVLFWVGQAFIHQTTVLPSFVSNLTDSPLAIGVIPALQGGGWLLPQVLAASYVNAKPRKKPYMLRAALAGRPLYWALGLAALLMGPSNPPLLLAAFYLAVGGFAVCDALASVPWWDILAKTIPYGSRGRVLGLWQIFSGLAAIAAGWVVAEILAAPALTFPLNYALLFAGAGTAFMLGLSGLASVREPVASADHSHQSLGDFMRQLAPTLRADPALKRVVVTRLLIGVGLMIFPFYIVYLTNDLGVSRDYIGLFISAQVVGNMVAGPVLGALGDRFGTCLIVKVATTAATLIPVVALVAGLWSGWFGPYLPYFCALIFVLIGVTFSSMMTGFMNHVLEIAPPNARSTYVALFNTVTGSLVVLPLISGAVVAVTSYAVIFVAAAVFGAISFGTACLLREPRRRPVPEIVPAPTA